MTGDGTKQQRAWACVGHEPTCWVLGVLSGGLMSHCIGGVERQANGSWSWWATHPEGFCPQGVSPSRVTAMMEVGRNCAMPTGSPVKRLEVTA